MLQFLNQQTVLFYAMAVACTLCAVSQIVLRFLYAGLLRDVKRQGMAKGRFMRQLRQRYQSSCRVKQNAVNPFNTEVFIKKNLLEYRFMGISLHGWKRTAEILAVLCAGIGMYGWYRNRGQGFASVRQMYLTGIFLTEGISLLLYGILDTKFAKHSLQIAMQDELDNAWILHAAGTSQTSFAGASVPSKEEKMASILPEKEVAAATEKSSTNKTISIPTRKKKTQKSGKEIPMQTQKDKLSLKENIGKIREGIRESAASADAPKEQNTKILRQMDSDEQERVIREVLKELLS